MAGKRDEAAEIAAALVTQWTAKDAYPGDTKPMVDSLARAIRRVVRRAVAEEREACAGIVERGGAATWSRGNTIQTACASLAAAIRARGGRK